MDDLALPIIDLNHCIVCGECEKNCPEHVVTTTDNAITFSHPQACTYCGICEDICPVNAIQLVYQIMPLNHDQKPIQSNKEVS